MTCVTSLQISQHDRHIKGMFDDGFGAELCADARALGGLICTTVGDLDCCRELPVGELAVFGLTLFTSWRLFHGLLVYGISYQSCCLSVVGSLPDLF